MAPLYKNIVSKARNAYKEGRTRPVEFRRQQLNQLRKMYVDNEKTFLQALKSDLNKPHLEAVIFETDFMLKDLDYILSRLDDWCKTQEVPSIVPEDKSFIYNDPYGVVLVMGAWNYPAQLTLIPAAGAIAAGNTVIMKPSEVSPATAKVIADLVPKYLDNECYPVVCGGIPETTELLKERFDYIFYTGSTGVGKIVRNAANQYLTPTTLELGGKSPCYIDSTADMDIAVRRILWGKMFNLGQTCIAPDYILCNKTVQDTFVQKAKEVLKEWYGNNPQQSPDLCRIVAERHVDRLVGYLNSGKVAVGGKYNKTNKWIEPTILTEVSGDSKIMQDEIFGPILPIVSVKDHVDVINFINDREKPLSMYLFSTNNKDVEAILQKVSCGGVTVNDTLHHAANHNLPFGGVGHSGMGAYHGDYTFQTFTHKKSVLIRGYGSAPDKILQNRYPPYNQDKLKVLTS